MRSWGDDDGGQKDDAGEEQASGDGADVEKTKGDPEEGGGAGDAWGLRGVGSGCLGIIGHGGLETKGKTER